MKIYCDNNILGSIVGLELSDVYFEALEVIAESNHELITSEKTIREMENAREVNIRAAIKFIYKTFGKKFENHPETYLATGFGDAPFGSVPFGGGMVENTALTILKQTFKSEDAEHIFQAKRNKADFFLTVDESTILKRYRNNHNGIIAFVNPMKIVNPVELVDILIAEE